MKIIKLFWLIVFVFPFLSKAQIVDDFSDGNITNNPVWDGNTESFEIIDPPFSGDGSINGNSGNDVFVLRSLQNVGDAIITTESEIAYGEWIFSVADGKNWSVSGSNDYKIILISDDNNIENLTDGNHNFNGYYLQFDGDLINGERDKFILYKQTGNISTVISDTNFPYEEDGNIPVGRTVKITRSIAGEWTIFIDEGFDIMPITQVCESVTDNEHVTSNYFGIATNIANPGDARVLYFDNLFINPAEIVAEKLLFSGVPDMVSLNTNFSVTVTATDENNNPVTDYDGEITLSLESGNGILSSEIGLVKNAVNGEYTWTDLQYNTEEFFSISADASDLISGNSGDIEAENIAIYIDENFENTNLESWINAEDWLASDENPITDFYSLKHNLEDISGTSYISHSLNGLPVNEGITTWRFNFKNGNWNPSTGNKFFVYLMADNQNLTVNNLNAYVVGINLDTDDDILKFWKISNGVPEMLISSEYSWQNGASVGIEIIRNEFGGWIFNYNPEGGFNNLQEAGIVNDNDFAEAYYFGTVFTYTSTRAGEFWLDDILVTGVVDEISPNLISLTALKPDSLIVVFNENLNQNSAEIISNYSVNSGIGNPISATLNQNNFSSVSLNFASNFVSGEENILTINGLEDFSGNQIINESGVFIYNNIIVQNVGVISDTELDIFFSKELDTESAQEITNYFVGNEIGNPDSVFVDADNNKLVHLIFAENFEIDVSYSILIENVKDIYKNNIASTNFDFSYFEVQIYDIILSEILCDINPLPEAIPPFKFLEIHNNSDYEINLSGWTMTIGENSPREFPEIFINSNEYIIVCEAESENEFYAYGKTIPVLNPSELTTTGKRIVIRNSENLVIEDITYSNEWYDDSEKAKGAWSLERIDLLNFCGENDNWTATLNYSGGTPGNENSANNENPDDTAPNIDTLKVTASNYLELYFDEKINLSAGNNPLNFFVDNEIGNPDSIVIDEIERNKINLFFENQFSDAEEYSLMIENISDNCENLIPTTEIKFTYNLIYPKEIWTKSQNLIKIIFSEVVDFQTGTDINNFFADNEIGNPEFINLSAGDNSILYLQFEKDFPDGQEINLNIKNIEDINRNKIKITDLKILYYVPKNNDIVINELLFNPFPEGEDFVEIYNRSEYKINFSDLQIAKRNDDNEIISQVDLFEYDYYFEPGKYFVFTKNKENILSNYASENSSVILEISDFPAYSDDEGTVIISYKNDSIIDEFSYNEDMHFLLLDDNEGVSLERINFDNTTNDENNWHSASEYSGFATPGYENSQHRPGIENELESVTIEPKIFSPDGDGTDDFTNIHYKFEKGGYVANIYIFDSNGMLIMQLANNQLLGTEGIIRWDGLYDNRVIARSGIYLVLFEVFDLEGNIKKYKKPVVLAVKM